MEKLFIVCVDDQSEVLTALERDLAPFDEKLMVEVCDTGQEALDLMEEIDSQGDHVAVVISDQVMPEMNGVTFLAKVSSDSRFSETQKILLTGQATHQDTIEAINLGGISQYLQKPWQQDQLIEVVKTRLTDFVLAKGIDYAGFQELMDHQRILEEMRKRV